MAKTLIRFIGAVFVTTAVVGVTTLKPTAQAGAGANAQVEHPTPKGETPAACLAEVRDYYAAQQKTIPALDPAKPNPERTAMIQKLSQVRLAMAKDCSDRFDPKTVADKDLADAINVYLDANATDRAKTAIDRALTVKTGTPSDRATILSRAVTVILREPISPERNGRLEKLVDELDAIPGDFTDQRFPAHSAMLGYYRYDDLDGGIIKHSTWLIENGKKLIPDQRKRYATSVISGYVDMAQAWAGQGMNDKALGLFRQALLDWADAPTVANRVNPEIERYSLVGTPGAPITAPRWLNMPAGKTSLDLAGKVTLLEFSAHWCVPCKESYPGVNRLRAKYGPQGFQVVLATQMYGYFQTEKNLPAETEFARDKTYFAEHGLDVPIAVGDRPAAATRSPGGTMTSPRDPNDAHYKVGGIPQIHLIDRQGRIRLVMVGYDDANEEKLAKMIEAMLKEK
jgi:thiol-disulfide isomerase/thioredoxin